MTWHKVELSIEEVSSGEIIKIVDQFSKIWEASGCPPDMELWGKRVPSGSDYKYELYFSPSSYQYTKTLIDKYTGVECNEPVGDNLHKLCCLQE